MTKFLGDFFCDVKRLMSSESRAWYNLSLFFRIKQNRYKDCNVIPGPKHVHKVGYLFCIDHS